MCGKVNLPNERIKSALSRVDCKCPSAPPIKKQISEQLSGYSDVTMTASGFQSGDNTVYLFTVEENDTGLITNQFYIVGEEKYCLVQESNFDKSEECNSVAKKLVESFKWK